MAPTGQDIQGIDPVLRETPTGWLAISEMFAPLRIAVVGNTEQAARDNFAKSIRAWARLQEVPDPFGETDV